VLTSNGGPQLEIRYLKFMLAFVLQGSPKSVLIRAAVVIALVAFADWRIEGNIQLGFLYLFPMLLVGSILNPWQIATVAALCTVLTEVFDGFEWSPGSGVPRDILIFAAFLCAGLFVHELARSRQLTLQHLGRIEDESEARVKRRSSSKFWWRPARPRYLRRTPRAGCYWPTVQRIGYSPCRPGRFAEDRSVNTFPS
jgi:hypothetical protein